MDPCSISHFTDLDFLLVYNCSANEKDCEIFCNCFYHWLHVLFTLIGLHDAEIHLPFQPFVCAITPCTESKYSRMKTHSGNGFMRWSYGGSQKGGASFNPFLHTRSMTLTVLFSVGSPTPILNRPIRQKWSLNKVKSSG